jgi:hypothetical protein
MKKAYQTPVLTAEEFELIDVIAASQPDDEPSTLENKNGNFEGPELEI